MATLDEAGYVVIKDRSKDVIIRGGENISSVDVENAIAAHPAVLEVRRRRGAGRAASARRRWRSSC